MRENYILRYRYLKRTRNSNHFSVSKFPIDLNKTKSLIYLILLLIPYFSYPQTKKNNQILDKEKNKLIQLYPVNIEGSWGYISKLGQIVIKPQFEEGGDFKNGLAKVKLSGKYGFINTNGRIVINPTLDMAYDFVDGLAKIKINNLYGFINEIGQIVIKPQFENVGEFKDGLAYISVAKKYGLINKKGEIVFNPISDEIPDFSEGLARIKIDFNYGFINQKGDIVIQPQFTSARYFAEGLCLVSDSWNQVSGFGYIDKKGNYVLNPQFGSGSSEFCDGIAAVGVNKKYGYINKLGKFIIQPQFNTAFPFSEGLAWVSYSEKGGGYFSEDAKYGCIDKSGRFVINPQNFFWPHQFSEGLSAVSLLDNGKIGNYGFINKLGDWVIAPQFKQAHSFHLGLAEVLLGENWGVVNVNGKYTEGEIIGDLIRFNVNNKICYLDRNFKWVWKP